jgi:hypothetical protein
MTEQEEFDLIMKQIENGEFENCCVEAETWVLNKSEDLLDKSHALPQHNYHHINTQRSSNILIFPSYD